MAREKQRSLSARLAHSSRRAERKHALRRAILREHAVRVAARRLIEKRHRKRRVALPERAAGISQRSHFFVDRLREGRGGTPREDRRPYRRIGRGRGQGRGRS